MRPGWALEVPEMKRANPCWKCGGDRPPEHVRMSVGLCKECLEERKREMGVEN